MSLTHFAAQEWGFVGRAMASRAPAANGSARLREPGVGGHRQTPPTGQWGMKAEISTGEESSATPVRPPRLTSHQRRLLAELEEVADLTRLDYPNIEEYEPDERTTRLKFMKNQIIRSQVIMDYTFVDEMLGAAICHYFFGKKKGFVKLWKTKKFRNFNHYVLEIMSLTEKHRLVRAIADVPKSVSKNIDALNALRNGLAHAFFPENLRSSKPIYKG
jgi:hypothetical protein